MGRSAPAARGCPPWSQPREALWLLVGGATARAAAPVALVVGVVLTAVNQGAIILGGHADAATWIRTAVNFAIPFLVASTGFLTAGRRRADPPSTGEQ